MNRLKALLKTFGTRQNAARFFGVLAALANGSYGALTGQSFVHVFVPAGIALVMAELIRGHVFSATSVEAIVADAVESALAKKAPQGPAKVVQDVIVQAAARVAAPPAGG